jgi:hypothetical protein
MISEDEVMRLNNELDRATTQSYVGTAITGAGLVLATIATVKLATRPKREPAVVVGPTVSATGGGATLLLRW